MIKEEELCANIFLLASNLQNGGNCVLLIIKVNSADAANLKKGQLENKVYHFPCK